MGWLGSEVCGIPEEPAGEAGAEAGCAGAAARDVTVAAVLPEEALAELVEELPEELLLETLAEALPSELPEEPSAELSVGSEELPRSRKAAPPPRVGEPGDRCSPGRRWRTGRCRRSARRWRRQRLRAAFPPHPHGHGRGRRYGRPATSDSGRKTLMRSGLASRVSLPSSVSPDSAQGRDRRTGSGYPRPPGSSVRRFCPPGRSPP